jgi:hypothetical protein
MANPTTKYDSPEIEHAPFTAKTQELLKEFQEMAIE